MSPHFPFQNDKFYSAAQDNTVKATVIKDGSPDGIVVRFTAPVTHMCLNSDGSKLYAGSGQVHYNVAISCSCQNFPIAQSIDICLRNI